MSTDLNNWRRSTDLDTYEMPDSIIYYLGWSGWLDDCSLWILLFSLLIAHLNNPG